ncbi:MAG: YciI family protein [Terracidiphilus sp.]
MNNLCFAALLSVAGIACASAQAQTAPASQAPSPPAMKTWFMRLIPPRPNFDKTLSESEEKLMQDHFAYWKDLYAKGICIFGGPVLDPKGVYGVMAFKAANEDEARALVAADPSVKAGVNKFELAEMRVSFPPKIHEQN